VSKNGEGGAAGKGAPQETCTVQQTKIKGRHDTELAQVRKERSGSLLVASRKTN